MKEVKAPNDFSKSPRPWLFLAGSIEQGKAVEWQAEVATRLATSTGTILNPRRDHWDATLKQSIDNPQFREQVEWELDALDAADAIGLYFDPATKSPISLLELGLYSRSKNLIVLCPEGFWRKGNVDIVCTRYGIKSVPNMDDFVWEVANFATKRK